MQVETNHLKTIKNYALSNKVTPAYIYKLIGEKKMKPTVIDGVQFIDAVEFPSLPTKK